MSLPILCACRNATNDNVYANYNHRVSVPCQNLDARKMKPIEVKMLSKEEVTNQARLWRKEDEDLGLEILERGKTA